MAEVRVIKVKVIPKSPKTEIVGQLDDGTLKIRVAAPPEKGKANDALIAFLAKHHQIPRANIDILTGETSPNKQLRLRFP